MIFDFFSRALSNEKRRIFVWCPSILKNPFQKPPNSSAIKKLPKSKLIPQNLKNYFHQSRSTDVDLIIFYHKENKNRLKWKNNRKWLEKTSKNWRTDEFFQYLRCNGVYFWLFLKWWNDNFRSFKCQSKILNNWKIKNHCFLGDS